MSNYTEAVLAGIAAAVIAGFAGAGASMPAAVSSPDPHAAALAVQLEAAAIAVRPEVSGRIAAINFAQDQQVKQGDLLVRIDPLPFEAACNQAQTRLGRARWRYLRAVSDRTRAAEHADSQAQSRKELESRMAAAEQAGADVKAAETALELAKRDLENTRVTAPVSGIARYADVTVGSLVTSGQTKLATVTPVAERVTPVADSRLARN